MTSAACNNRRGHRASSLDHFDCTSLMHMCSAACYVAVIHAAGSDALLLLGRLSCMLLLRGSVAAYLPDKMPWVARTPDHR